MTKKVLLIIMDGWGEREAADQNAVKLGRTPVIDRLRAENPFTLVNTSGVNVGLPEGLMGNSEVGHLNLGAGRVVYQDIMRITKAIDDGSFFDNRVLVEAIDRVKKSGTLHLIGLVSDGGVHSLQTHLEALVRLAGRRGVTKVAIHALLDGRDTPPRSGAGYLRQLRKFLDRTGYGTVATVMGRYYAMDRDKRWDRVARAYEAMTQGKGERTADYIAAVEASYRRQVNDEFVEPIVVEDSGGQPAGLIEEGDAAIFFNFRADRARQLCRALFDQDFDGFKRAVFPKLHVSTMTEYDITFPLPVAFSPETMPNILAEVAARAGKKNLRLAETEKYAHVTYFFNGGREEPFEGESRILIPSPKVATYDLQPEMSAPEVADTLIRELENDTHDFIICNFANGDMVGHTGVLDAAIKAVETVDGCVGRIMESVDSSRYAVIITADHGNAEMMFDPGTGDPHTAHTSNLVPCILIDPDYTGALIEDGSLRDFAPTICNYVGIPVPPEMTGRDLRRDI